MQVVAVVFWGRHRYTSLLQPYLSRELAVNGGVLDEIWLCINTLDKKASLVVHNHTNDCSLSFLHAPSNDSD